jgi:hypothetical protein
MKASPGRLLSVSALLVSILFFLGVAMLPEPAPPRKGAQRFITPLTATALPGSNAARRAKEKDRHGIKGPVRMDGMGFLDPGTGTGRFNFSTDYKF